jgi:hypothetical protein
MKLKILFFIALVLLGGGAYYYLDNIAPSEVVTISPIKYPYKIKAPQEESLFSKESEKLVYQNFEQVKDKKKSEVNILPEPEAPISLSKENSQGEIFDIPESQAHSTQDVNKSESIWDLADDSDQNNVKIEKTLKITSLKDKNHKKEVKEEKKKKNIFYSQLGYFRSDKLARQEWAKIKQANKKHLSKSNPTIKKVKKKNGGYHFELLVGPYDEFKSSKYLCKKITLKNQNCIVVKN